MSAPLISTAGFRQVADVEVINLFLEFVVDQLADVWRNNVIVSNDKTAGSRSQFTVNND